MKRGKDSPLDKIWGHNEKETGNEKQEITKQDTIKLQCFSIARKIREWQGRYWMGKST